MKTLKELIEENDDELTFGGYTEDVLQDAAKEWIKNTCWEDWLKTQNCPKCKDELEYNYEGEYRCNKCHLLLDPIELWIRYFFNLEG